MSSAESEIDLVLDRNSEDESRLPWSFVDERRDPSLIREGAWLIVGEGTVRVAAQVTEIEGDMVVRPLPGPVDEHRSLLPHDVLGVG
jgi:hypothetical protein